jgi:hypothetical protein
VIESDSGWLDWYRSLNAVPRLALVSYIATDDVRLVKFFWPCLPDYAGQPLPLYIEWLWMGWYTALPRVYQLALNAYFNVDDDRLLLHIWDALFLPPRLAKTPSTISP